MFHGRSECWRLIYIINIADSGADHKPLYVLFKAGRGLGFWEPKGSYNPTQPKSQIFRTQPRGQPIKTILPLHYIQIVYEM